MFQVNDKDTRTTSMVTMPKRKLVFIYFVQDCIFAKKKKKNKVFDLVLNALHCNFEDIIFGHYLTFATLFWSLNWFFPRYMENSH